MHQREVKLVGIKATFRGKLLNNEEESGSYMSRHARGKVLKSDAFISRPIRIENVRGGEGPLKK